MCHRRRTERMSRDASVDVGTSARNIRQKMISFGQTAVLTIHIAFDVVAVDLPLSVWPLYARDGSEGGARFSDCGGSPS